MGGKSDKSVTVGYRYFLGMHMVLCHGPVDLVTSIKVADRTVWSGASGGGQLVVDEPNVFGGEEREGGIQGLLTLAMGGPEQAQNEYLRHGMFGRTSAFLGPAALRPGRLFGNVTPQNIPAYRGVVSAILEKMYLGTNAYLKHWKFRLSRTTVRQNGLEQWYVAKASIGGVGEAEVVFEETFSVGNLNRYANYLHPSEPTIGIPTGKDFFRIVLDDFGACVECMSPNEGEHPVISAPVAFVAPLQSVRFKFKNVARGGDDNGSLVIRDAADNVVFSFGVARDATFEPLQRPTVNFVDEVGGVGHPIGDGPVDVGIWYQAEVNYDSNIGRFDCTVTRLDTGEVHGAISVISEGRGSPVKVQFANDDGAVDDGRVAGVSRFDDVTISVALEYDMNPAHIIRECLTDPDWGLGYGDEDIDDAAFMAAADALFAEGMGISILWTRETPIEDFINEIIRHIDAALYVDRTTGKFVLKLIRGDYDAEALPILGRDDIQAIEEFTRPTFGELINSVIVNYWNIKTGRTATVSAQDIAMVAMQGGEIVQSVAYPGFTRTDLAARVAARDLKSLSTPLATGTLIANQNAADLTIGSVFKLDWPDYGDELLIMRVTAIAHGDGRSNLVRIQCTEDVFALPTEGIVVAPGEEWTDPLDEEIAPLADRLSMEMPYLSLVRRMGQTFIADVLEANPEAGYLQATAINNGAGINAKVLVDVGDGYEETGVTDFCPWAELAQDVEPDETLFAITGGVGIEDVDLGSLAQLGSEILRVDAIGEETVTLGRGCLDAVPAKHFAGDKIFFFEGYARTDAVEYVLGEILGVKLLPTAAAATLAEADAPADQLTMDQRATRPYPPGNFQINGEPYPPVIAGDAGLSLTWAHRDRLQQTSGDIIDTTAGDIGPEAGTTYTVRIYDEADQLLREEAALAVTAFLYTTADELDDEGAAVIEDPHWADVQLLLNMNGEDAATDFPDASVDARSVTANGNAQVDTERLKFGTGALLLDGSGDYLTVPHDAVFSLVPQLFTVDCWVYVPSSHKTAAAVVSKREVTAGGGQREWQMQLSDGEPVFIAFNTSGDPYFNFRGPDPIPLDQWVHLEWAYDGTAWRIWVNGVVVASNTATTGAAGTNSAPVQIGRDITNATRDLNGWIDDLRVTVGSTRHTSNFTPPLSEAGQFQSDPDARLNGKLRVELESVRDALLSYQKHNYTVLREGYGFNYGELYGGQ